MQIKLSSQNQEVIDHGTVLLFSEKACHTQSREGQEVIAADLEKGQEIRILYKLQDAVDQSHQNPGARSIPVGNQHDEKHGKQRNSAAHGKLQKADI